jgi:hypothetical protein
MRAMTNGTDSKDENEEAKPYGEGLWKDVRFWFDAILAVFGDLKELMHVGLTRSLAVKLCNWLWGVEGAVRRLIIAEALKRDPASPADVRTKTDAAPATRASRKRRPSFRVRDCPTVSGRLRQSRPPGLSAHPLPSRFAAFDRRAS